MRSILSKVLNNNKMELGENSLKKLATCHPDIQKILKLAITRTKVDFGISEGHRPIEKQQEYYAIGRTTQMHRNTITNADGINKKGKHNYNPSMAVDIYVWHKRQATREQIGYDGLHLSYVAGIIDACAEFLYERGEIKHKIRWGGNWNGDGIIIFDQNLDDMPHFELI